MEKEPIYRFYAELRNDEPKKWRRFEISGDITMEQLARMIGVLFNIQSGNGSWFDVPAEENFKVCVGEYIENEINQKALKMFRENPERATLKIGLSPQNKDDSGGRVMNAQKTCLKNVLDHENERVIYQFGSGLIDLVLEKVIEANMPIKDGLPHALEGNDMNPDEINARLKFC